SARHVFDRQAVARPTAGTGPRPGQPGRPGGIGRRILDDGRTEWLRHVPFRQQAMTARALPQQERTWTCWPRPPRRGAAALAVHIVKVLLRVAGLTPAAAT